MAEEQHTPAPQEARGIYGFVLFLMMVTCIILYFLWMLLPPEIFENEWLPYEPPQQYWGFAVPIFLCTCLFLFAFCIYPGLHGLYDGQLDHQSSYRDQYSLHETYFEEEKLKAKAGDKIRKQRGGGTLKPRSQRKKSGQGKTELLSEESTSNRASKVIQNKSYTWTGKRNQKQEEDAEVLPLPPPSQPIPVPVASDMDLMEVCKTLYLKRPGGSHSPDA